MAVQRRFDDSGQILTIAHIIQREQTVTRRLRQRTLHPVVSLSGFVVESGIPIHVEPVAVNDTDDARLSLARQCPGTRVLQSEHVHKGLRNGRVEFLTVVAFHGNRVTILLFVRRDLADQPKHLIRDVAGRTQIHDLRLVRPLPQTARQDEERCGMPMAETLDRMILVIRSTLRLVEFDLDETARVRILAGIGELHVRQVQHRRGRRDDTIPASRHSRVHLRTGRQCSQQGEHVFGDRARLIVISERLAVHLIIHRFTAKRIAAASAIALHAESGKHLADTQHAKQRLTGDQRLPVTAMAGQHVGKLLERFQPWGREHATQVRIGLLVDGQPSEDPFSVLQRLIAHAGR